MLITTNYSFPIRKSIISRFIFKLNEHHIENFKNSFTISVSFLYIAFINEIYMKFFIYSDGNDNNNSFNFLLLKYCFASSVNIFSSKIRFSMLF